MVLNKHLEESSKIFIKTHTMIHFKRQRVNVQEHLHVGVWLKMITRHILMMRREEEYIIIA